MTNDRVIALLKRRIVELEAQNEGLTGRLRALESEIGFVAPGEWGLTPTENAHLGLLLAREFATRSALLAAGAPYRKCEEPHWTIIGVQIGHRWGAEYYLTPDNKQRLRAAVDRRIAA